MLRYLASPRIATALRSTRAATSIIPLERVSFFSTSEKEPVKELIYEAPLTRPVQLMKRVSLTSCTLTSIGMPVTCLYGPTTSSIVAQWAMCGTVMFFGVGTTALFHVLFKPYVLRLWIDRSTEKITVETLNLLAMRKTTEFHISETSIPEKSMHPMINFKVAGSNYFIHPEAFEENDRSLVERMLHRPFEELVPKKVVDDDQEEELEEEEEVEEEPKEEKKN